MVTNPEYLPETINPNTQLKRIADALERIAKQLEKWDFDDALEITVRKDE